MRLIIVLAVIGAVPMLAIFGPGLLLHEWEWNKARKEADMQRNLQRARELDAAGLRETWEVVE